MLAPAALDLQALFRTHGYEDGIIFGHAKDGNLHFVISQSFNDEAAIRQYEAFNRDLVEMVVGKYDGSLKAEHGTGRNMAPFVEAEWGGAAFDIMVRVKSLVDPQGLLNPGVLVNHDPEAHIKDLKSLPEVEAEVDKCIECGFCESLCPSRDLTLTPRQRIVVRRAMERPGADVAALREAYQYDALDTCATDGLCALACPVSIDTGRLTKRLRASMASPAARRVAATAATHFATTQRLVRTSLRASRMAGPLRRLAAGRVPGFGADLPAPAGPLPETRAAGAAAILFPSCVSRTMGPEPGEPPDASVPAAMIAVAARAGVALHIPSGIEQHCCGMPFSSKGYQEAQAIAANATIDTLWDASQQGALPVVDRHQSVRLRADARGRLERREPRPRGADAPPRRGRVLPHQRGARAAAAAPGRVGRAAPGVLAREDGQRAAPVGPRRGLQRSRLRPALVGLLRLCRRPRFPGSRS